MRLGLASISTNSALHSLLETLPMSSEVLLAAQGALGNVLIIN